MAVEAEASLIVLAAAATTTKDNTRMAPPPVGAATSSLLPEVDVSKIAVLTVTFLGGVLVTFVIVFSY